MEFGTAGRPDLLDVPADRGGGLGVRPSRQSPESCRSSQRPDPGRRGTPPVIESEMGCSEFPGEDRGPELTLGLLAHLLRFGGWGGCQGGSNHLLRRWLEPYRVSLGTSLASVGPNIVELDLVRVHVLRTFRWKAYINPDFNHPNVCKYASPTECLGYSRAGCCLL